MFRAMSRFQWKAMLLKMIPTASKARRKPTGRGKRPFRFAIEGHVFTIKAPTRSEARAILKKDLGLKRLPIGCTIHDAPPATAAAA